MNPLIECCEQNIAKGNQLLLTDGFINENTDVITYSCMNECKLCAKYDFVLFEGERLIANSPEELKVKIDQAILNWQNEIT